MKRRLATGLLLGCLGGANGCASGDAAVLEGTERPDPVQLACAPPSDATSAPTTLNELFDFANELSLARDEPLTLPCLVASLKRPLGVLAAQSLMSLQPSVSARSPRIFLFSGALVASLVPAGTGRELLELSELIGETRSIKAELGFPLPVPLSNEEPFSRIRSGAGTVCGACHGTETPATSQAYAAAFESDVLRPRASQELPLEAIAAEALGCDPESEPERCALLDAVFGHGKIHPSKFSERAATF